LRSRSWGAYQNVRIGQIANAEGANLRLPKARRTSRLGDLGSVVNSPSGVWRSLTQKPKRFWAFHPKIGSILGSCKSQIF